MKKVILIGGLAGAGKDTSADMVKELLKEDSVIYAFADPIKQILATALGITVDTLNHYKEDKRARLKFVSTAQSMCTGTNTRQLLQNFGNDAMKKVFGKYVWVTVANSIIEQVNTEWFIVSDFRVKEEYNYLVQQGLEIITVNILKDSQEAGDGHITENDLKDFDFDYLVDNNGTLEGLAKSIKELVRDIENG